MRNWLTQDSHREGILDIFTLASGLLQTECSVANFGAECRTKATGTFGKLSDSKDVKDIKTVLNVLHCFILPV